MSGGLRITVRAGERIFVNGAVLRVDRKVGLEVLNDVTFLLEQHVIKPEETYTPLRQLYFMVQTMLIEPTLFMQARDLANASLSTMLVTLSDEKLLTGLSDASQLLENGRPLDALKKIRQLFPLEDQILNAGTSRLADTKEVA
ncbi:MAG: flagellar biosynthesis repressor FlbT [Hyphomicrobium sp.]|nr:flagellar biosynthesis repressor FlbT [Hyphomicrobium sp.]